MLCNSNGTDNERTLWDVTFANYSNLDERKSTLARISQEMDGVDKATHLQAT